MKSQVKWGLLLIIIGLILVPFGFPFLLFYAIPLILIGISIICLPEEGGTDRSSEGKNSMILTTTEQIPGYEIEIRKDPPGWLFLRSRGLKISLLP